MNGAERLQLQAKVRKAQEASHILDNSGISNNFREILAKCHEDWADTKANEKDKREELYLLLFATRGAHALWEKRLTDQIDTGKLAAHDLETEQYDPGNVPNGVDDSTGLTFTAKL